MIICRKDKLKINNILKIKENKKRWFDSKRSTNFKIKNININEI